MQAGSAGPAIRVITALTAAAWVLQMLFWPLDYAALVAGFVPQRFALDVPALDIIPKFVTPLTATLVHGGFLHLVMNLITFYYCGKLVEHFLGTRSLLILYVVGAYASAGFQYLAGSDQPMIGASGAISAVVGAYAMLFSTSEAKRWGPISAEWMRALWLLAGWVGVQWLIGIASSGAGYSVAIAAHIGGFIAGLLLAKPLLQQRFS